MSTLAELVEIVIGVGTRAVPASVSADKGGYTEPVPLSDAHGGPHGWAIEGATGCRQGTALAWLVISVSSVNSVNSMNWSSSSTVRFTQPAARGRSPMRLTPNALGRDALSRTRLAQPKAGPDQVGSQVLLTGAARSPPPRPHNGSAGPW